MSDYLMRTLIRQRHEQIMTEIRADQKRPSPASKDAMAIKHLFRRLRGILTGRHDRLHPTQPVGGRGRCR